MSAPNLGFAWPPKGVAKKTWERPGVFFIAPNPGCPWPPKGVAKKTWERPGVFL